MLYLMGVDHSVQYTSPGTDNQRAYTFIELVDNIIYQHKIEVLAEEFSNEACASNHVSESLCCMYAREHHLKHIYCDPNTDERKSLGIRSHSELMSLINSVFGESPLFDATRYSYYKCLEKEDFPQREQFWLENIMEMKHENILFICGSAHLPSFSYLLTVNDWSVRLI